MKRVKRAFRIWRLKMATNILVRCYMTGRVPADEVRKTYICLRAKADALRTAGENEVADILNPIFAVMKSKYAI